LRKENKIEKDQNRKTIILECVKFFENGKLFYLLACGTACALLKYSNVYAAPKDDYDQHDIDFYARKRDYNKIRPKIDPYFQDKLGYKIIKNAEFKIQMEKQIAAAKIMVEFYLIEFLNDSNYKKIKYSTNGDNIKYREIKIGEKVTIDSSMVNIVDKNYCQKYYANI
jgi:hypothetical protein